MTDEADLLRAILANPAEDTPRLMYADWLQDRGQEARATGIRFMLTPEWRDDEWPVRGAWMRFVNPDSGLGRQQAAELRARVRVANPRRGVWPAGFPDSVDLIHGAPRLSADGHYGMIRGFVESVTCTAADWLRHADAITAAHPAERVTLTSLPDMQWVVDSWDIVRRANLEPRQSMVRDSFRARWPGIEFVIPPAVIMDALAQVG